jgi:RimJ/RimL family protein N-acetyltransferase
MYLATRRLLLRPLQAGDVPALLRIWTDPEVTRFMGGPRDPSRLAEQLEVDLHNPAQQTFDLWPVVEKATGRLVGHCGLLDKEVDGRAEVELVYVFDRQAWGQGFATEIAPALKHHAFAEMGLRRLISLIDPENAASACVAEAAGLHLEKETVRPGGKVLRVYATEPPLPG